MRIDRRSLIAAAAALPLVSIGHARAAEFTYRMATNAPEGHPLNLRAQEAAGRILEATGGRVEIAVYGNSKLGNDTIMYKKLVAGEVELFALIGLATAGFVPAASISALGFIFTSYQQVWGAMDGSLGNYIRAEITKQGPLVLARMWDNGFRQLTSNVKPIAKPMDLSGLKLRVPVSPVAVSMFTALGAQPVGITMDLVYNALNNHTVDAQENPLAFIRGFKFSEVQAYCSLTNHIWDGMWMLANEVAWRRLPPSTRDIVEGELDRSILQERADLVQLSPNVRGDLITAGLDINTVDANLFKETLRQAGFYSEWRNRLGQTAWRLLEDHVGSVS